MPWPLKGLLPGSGDGDWRIRIGVAEDKSFDLNSQSPVRISYFTKIAFKIYRDILVNVDITTSLAIISKMVTSKFVS